MTSRIINIPMRDNIIDCVCGHIKRDIKTAVISGGKRPFLFITKKLSGLYGKSVASPSFFTNDEFAENIIFKNTGFSAIPDIEAAFMVYEAVSSEVPELLKGKKSFDDFMQWAMEILFFIEQSDLEKVPRDRFMNVKANADIGYEVPENINNLLKSIFKIRESFHASLESSKKITKGYSFLKASETDAKKIAGDYEEYILLAPYYLHRTEFDIYKKIFRLGKLIVITQGNPAEHESLKKIYSEFDCVLPDEYREKNGFGLNVYSAYDDQSQAALLKNLLAGLPEGYEETTAVIVPEAKMLQAVISEVSQATEHYNVSAGYSASKTSVFSLIRSIIEAQLSRKGGQYYVKDIIKVLSDPLVKNTRFFADSSLSRITAHKIEQSFDSGSESALSGKLFASFEEICGDEMLLKGISETVKGTAGYISTEKLKGVLEEVFFVLFKSWEKAESLRELGSTLHSFIEKIDALSPASSYPLNSEAMEILLSLSRQMKYGKVADARFVQSGLLKIFSGLMENKKIPLPGSPLQGLQILGMLESRNLSFKNVYFIGMTDSAMPSVKKESALVPKDIMSALGIEMSKKEYDIQNYHFQRITAGAENVNLIYPDNEKDERSRFIEKLVWQKQFDERDMSAVQVKAFSPAQFKTPDTGKKKI